MCTIYVVLFRDQTPRTPVDIIVHMATRVKNLPEAYNTFVHALGFAPSSILHRIDAIFYALQFVR